MNMPALKHSQIHQGLHTFINEEVLPACDIEINVFWQALEKLIADYNRQPSVYINEQRNKINERSNKCLAANTKVVPVIDSQQLIQAANSKWTSLLNMGNAAIRSKDYLDQHFALASGSHSHVKNYVVYYHHLLAFLEDGSQTGLANPSQFVALSGHKCAPDSIVLKAPSAGLHIEIIFDRKGNQGSQDIASIEDILLENNETIVIDFNAVSLDGASKLQAYRNLQAFLRYDLSTFVIENGQQKILRMRKDVSFTDKNRDDYCIDNKAPIQIQCASQSLVSELMCDNKGELAPQIIMDAVFTTLIMRGVYSTSSASTQNLLLLEEGCFTSEMTRKIDKILAL